jgi:hypothetical protein
MISKKKKKKEEEEEEVNLEIDQFDFTFKL